MVGSDIEDIFKKVWFLRRYGQGYASIAALKLRSGLWRGWRKVLYLCGAIPELPLHYDGLARNARCSMLESSKS